jgi:hypothetical protein
MSIDENDLLSSVPDPTYIKLIAALVRGLLQIASGLGFGWALAVTGDQVMMVATAIVMLGTLIWSFWQKFQEIKHRKQAAVASAVQSANATAKAGEPVAVVVTNPKKGP